LQSVGVEARFRNSFSLRARLQPCRNSRKINEALAPEVSFPRYIEFFGSFF